MANAPTLSILGAVDSLTDLDDIWPVAVQGDYLYAGRNLDAQVTVVDISDPASPAVVETLVDFTNLNGPTEMIVEGDYLYVSCASGDGLTVLDISTPTSISVHGSIVGHASLNGAAGIVKDGDFIYVAAGFYDGLAVVDVSTPASPSVVGSVSNVAMNAVSRITKSGNYCYLTSQSDNRFSVVNVSNPAAPTFQGSLVDATNLDGAAGLAAFGTYALVACYDTDKITVVDASTPTTPVIETVLTPVTGSGGTVRLLGVEKHGDDYAFVAWAQGTIFVIDMTDPTAPFISSSVIDTTDLDWAENLASNGSDTLVVSRGVLDGITILSIDRSIVPGTVIATVPAAAASTVSGSVPTEASSSTDNVVTWQGSLTAPAPIWVRDDRYLPGNMSGGQRAIPTTGALLQYSNYANSLIANYGLLSTITTVDATGILDTLQLPVQATRRLWGAAAISGTKLALIGHSYDAPEATNPARLYDLSDPSNITLITSKTIGLFGVTSQMTLSGACLDPNNVLWYPGSSGATTRIIGSDFDSGSTTTYGPFNLSHSVVLPDRSMVDTMWLYGGVYYGAISGRQTLSLFSQEGVLSSVSLGTGASNVVNGVHWMSSSRLLVFCSDSGVYKVIAIDISNPVTPTVAWTWLPGTYTRFAGRVDAYNVLISGSTSWRWFNISSQTITRTLLFDSGNYAAGGFLLSDGSIAAFGNDGGQGDGFVFIPDAVNYPSSLLSTPGPRPWRDPVAQPAVGLGTPIVLWDSRNWDGGATLYNEGSGGDMFDLEIVSTGDEEGDGIYAIKRVNWYSNPNLGPNADLPDESDFGGDWSAGPLTFIYALPPGHISYGEDGWTEVNCLPGDGGGYNFVGMSAYGFSYHGGFSGLYGASLSDSIGEGTFMEAYWAEALTESIMNQDDTTLLVVLYIDPASSTLGVWVRDAGGVHQIAYETNAVDGYDTDECSFSNGTWPTPEYDSVGVTSERFFSYFGETWSHVAPGQTWDGIVWAGLYRGRPDLAGLTTMWEDSVTPPKVAITKPVASADPTGTEALVVFDVVFSEVVTGFTVGDVSLTGSTAGGTLTAHLSGSGKTYSVNVTGMTTGGTVVVSIPASSATSVASGLANTASTAWDNSILWQVCSSSITDTFTRANEAIIASPWLVSPATGSTIGITSNVCRLQGGTTINPVMWHETPICGESVSIEATTQYSARLGIRMGAANPSVTIPSSSSGYFGGRLYFGSGINDWRWSMVKNNVELMTVSSQFGSALADTTDTRFELEDNGDGTVTLSLYVNDVLLESVLDSSPLTNTGRIGVAMDGRGSSYVPTVDSLSATGT